MKNTIILILFFILLLLPSCKDEPLLPPPPSLPDSTSHNFIWEIDTIGYFQSVAKSVWATNRNNIWVFGLFYSSPDFSRGSNIAHWNGQIGFFLRIFGNMY